MLQHSYEYTCFVIARFLWLDDSVEDSGGSGEGAGDLNSKKTKQYPLFVTSGKVFVLFFFFGGGGLHPNRPRTRPQDWSGMRPWPAVKSQKFTGSSRVLVPLTPGAQTIKEF